MKKSITFSPILFLSVFSILVLMVSATTTTIGMAHAEKYQNDSFGYSLFVPEGFDTIEPYQNILIITSESQNDSNGVDNINVLVTKNNDVPFDEMVLLVEKDLINYGNVITEKKEITINDRHGIIIQSSNVKNGFPILFENAVVYDDNLVYFITLTYTDNVTFQKFYSVLESFEFANSGDDDDDENSKTPYIAKWVQDTAKAWSDNQISDEEFVDSIKYLIDFAIIDSVTPQDKDDVIMIPQWLKSPAKMWGNDTISNAEWIALVEYLHLKNQLSVSMP